MSNPLAKSNARRVTLVDIAERAEVSSMTVSMVLNERGGRTRVSEATARRVRRISAEMDYRPNLAARQMARQRSNLIGAVVDSHAPEQTMAALVAMEQLATERGYRLMVGYIHDDYERLSGHVDDFLSWGVEGAICLSHTYPQLGHRIPQLFEEFRNRVFLEQPLSSTSDAAPSLSWVGPNRVSAARQATAHLLQLGRRRIALAQPPNGYYAAEETRHGYEEAFRQARVAIDQTLVWETDVYAIDGLEPAEQCVDDLLPRQPDAWITHSDESAMWLIRALVQRGCPVPQDVAVVSVGRQALGRAFMPALTTVDLQGPAMGRAAMEMLLEDIEKPTEEPRPSKHLRIEPRLFINESCGAHLNSFTFSHNRKESP